jgi:hypothetical protein
MTDAVATEDQAVLTDYRDALAEAGAASHVGPRERMGEQLVRTFLTFWDDPQVRPQLLATFTAAGTDEAAADRMRAFMSTQLFAKLAQSLDTAPMTIDDVAAMLGVPALHLNAAVSQVAGVIMLRYVLKIEPIASAPAEDVVAVLAPTIQRYLVG